MQTLQEVHSIPMVAKHMTPKFSPTWTQSAGSSPMLTIPSNISNCIVENFGPPKSALDIYSYMYLTSQLGYRDV